MINLEKRPRKGHGTLGKSRTPCGEDACQAAQAWHRPGPPAEPGGRQVASCALVRVPFSPRWALGHKGGEAGPGSAARFPFRFWPPQRGNVFFMYFLTQGESFSLLSHFEEDPV